MERPMRIAINIEEFKKITVKDDVNFPYYLDYSFQDNDAKLEIVDVRALPQSEGYGSAMMRKLIKLAIEKNVDEIYGFYGDENISKDETIKKEDTAEDEKAKKNKMIRKKFYDKFLFEEEKRNRKTCRFLRKEKFESALKVEDSGRDYKAEELRD